MCIRSNYIVIIGLTLYNMLNYRGTGNNKRRENMKQKTARVIILILVLAMTFSAVMAGCGKKIEAGDY